jgi:hypothetical protein
MSIRISTAVWQHSKQQKAGALLILLAIADYANDHGVAWPSVRTLAKKTRMSKRNVQRWFIILQCSGELQISRNKGPHGSNLYKICVPIAQENVGVTHDTDDTSAAGTVTSASSTDDAGVTQTVNESSLQPSPVVPKGDGTDFWIRTSFKCFGQAGHPLRPHVLRALCSAIPALNKAHAKSLIEFYQTEPLDSKEQPYSSRRHSPERLMLDLPRQLGLAVQACPPPALRKRPEFTIDEIRDYLTEFYPGCPLPGSLEELDGAGWLYMCPEIYRGLRERKKNAAKSSVG